MKTQTGAATAHGTGRTAPEPGGRKTTARVRIPAAGGTPSRRTMTGLMTGGSPAKSGSLGTGAMRMMVLTGAATATGSGRTAPEPGGRTTTALMNAAGGTLSKKTMTGLMTGGSPATSGIPGKSAGGATTSGGGTTAGVAGGVTLATGSPAMVTGSTGTTSHGRSTGLLPPIGANGLTSRANGEHWICQGLQQQNPEWLRSHAFLPVHAGETAFY